MKHFVLVLAALAPLGAVACKSSETKQQVSDGRTVTLLVTGMT